MAQTNSGLLMSMGTVNMWGFSPAFDMLEDLPRMSEPTPINLLIINPGDIRHMLHTISRRRRWDASRPVHIFVYEKSIETLARHFLLLQIAQDWELPLRQRCNLFLEVFGNARVQERTSVYIESKAKALMDLLHNERGVLADLFDLSHLKMRTRDDLIDTFRGWYQNVKFDVNTLRDHRLRHYYGVRYDYRNNLIDWDYTMNLKKIENASVIHIKQYREWRNSGIAFEFGDQTYTEPNRTMASYTEAKKKHHGSVLCRGLWTDIIISPYISFGVKSDTPNNFAKQLFEIHNKGTGVEQNRHNTTEVCAYNILSYLHEIETGEVYKMKKAHDVYSGIGESEYERTDNQDDASGSRFVELKDNSDPPNSDIFTEKAREIDAQRRAKTILESFEGIKIIPLTGKLEDICSRTRYNRRFEHVFLSSQHTNILHLGDGDYKFTNLLTDKATVSIESSVFLLPLTEEQRILYVTKLLEMTTALALKSTFTFGGKHEPSKEDMTKIQHSVLRFAYDRQ